MKINEYSSNDIKQQSWEVVVDLMFLVAMLWDPKKAKLYLSISIPSLIRYLLAAYTTKSITTIPANTWNPIVTGTYSPPPNVT